MWKFQLPGPVETLTLKDVHVAWAGSDRVRLSTSTDGQRWTLRYDQDANSKATAWQAEIAKEQADSQTLFVRYEFEADHRERPPGDRRGVCIRRVELHGRLKE